MSDELVVSISAYGDTSCVTRAWVATKEQALVIETIMRKEPDMTQLVDNVGLDALHAAQQGHAVVVDGP